MTKIAPYGTWMSPVTTELVVGQTIGLSSVMVDGADVWWLESRPNEAGRSVLVRRGADGLIRDMTPPPFDVASRVHEYGGGAAWVQDGRAVFSHKRDGSVWLIEGDAAPRQVAATAGCRYADFRFLPGRDAVVCVREDHRDRPPTDPRAAIVLLDLSGDPAQDGRVLVQGPDFLAAPRPSPDGRALAWFAWDHPDMPWDATRLYRAPLDGDALGAPALVAGGPGDSVIHPAWSPAGVLHYLSDRSGWWNIYRDDGSHVCPLAAEIGGPHWTFGPRWFAFLPGGDIVAAVIQDGSSTAAVISGGQLRPLALGQVAQCPVPVARAGGPPALAFVCVPPDAPPAVVLAEPDADGTGWAGATILRASGPAVLDPQDISLAQPFDFATPDGERAHAFWYPPANAGFAAPEGERPPLIVMSHGGPTGMTGTGFSPRIQWWTSRGFAVVDVNYRGSTGYGRAYRHRLDGAWGVVDVIDCIAAAQHLVATGAADAARLAIRGGSAGGFTTLAALTSTDVFRAGASLYGIGDLKLLASDTHKFESRYLDRLIGRLPEDAAIYEARSPINRIDALRCGVIFFQGLEDRVVPPNQARLFVQAMQARGLPVAHYEFAGEGHGFRRAETLRRVLELELDFYGRLFGFTPPGLAERVVLLAEGSPPG
jgi:dipeptidyl aminopeptidase/acylaminoacyl peptidase